MTGRSTLIDIKGGQIHTLPQNSEYQKKTLIGQWQVYRSLSWRWPLFSNGRIHRGNAFEFSNNIGALSRLFEKGWEYLTRTPWEIKMLQRGFRGFLRQSLRLWGKKISMRSHFAVSSPDNNEIGRQTMHLKNPFWHDYLLSRVMLENVKAICFFFQNWPSVLIIKPCFCHVINACVLGMFVQWVRIIQTSLFTAPVRISFYGKPLRKDAEELSSIILDRKYKWRQ